MLTLHYVFMKSIHDDYADQTTNMSIVFFYDLTPFFL